MFEATEVSLEPGAYRARLQGIEEADGSNFETGEPEKYRRWTFEILEEGFEGTELFASSTMAFGPRSKARKWVEALLGRKVEGGQKIGLEDLQGLEVDLGVVLKETDRGSFGKIDSVNPVRKKSRAAEQTENKRLRDLRDGRAPLIEKPGDEDLEEIPF